LFLITIPLMLRSELYGKNDQEEFPEPWGLICKISETGFESENDQDLYMATASILDELGIEYETNEESQELINDVENEIDNKESFFV